MGTETVEELVFGAEGAERSLRQEGLFPRDWLARYQAAIDDSQATSAGWTWPKKLFQSLHFASTHLALRYSVWKTSSGSRIPETEYTLSEIQFATEDYLWSSVSRISKWSAASNTLNPLSKNGTRLVELCLGDDSPVREADAYGSFHPWKNAYELCLRQNEESCKTNTDWPKWLCVAIHFASFYVDLFQIRLIDPSRDVVQACERSQKIDSLVSGLRKHISNECVLALIKLWLSSCGVRRDNSGLPDVGERRPRTGQFISVRTMSEIFLQVCSVVAF